MESIYKIDTGSDHVAKFRGDRPTELGDYALKKKIKKTSRVKQKTSRTTVPGGLISISMLPTVYSPDTDRQYTPCPEKNSLEHFRYNFIKYWPILEVILLLQSAGNLQ